MDLPYDISHAPLWVREFYIEMVEAGEKPRLAEMLALQQAPRANSDREFLEGQGMLGDQLTPYQLYKLKENAKARGITLGHNDVYVSSLAEEPLDPRACVPATGGRSHVSKVCRDRGWACEGSVKEQGRDQKELEKVPLAPDLVRETVKTMLKENPDNARKPTGELVHEATERHGGKGGRAITPKKFPKPRLKS